MFSSPSPSPSPSPPASLKRKSTSSTPPTPNKRARLVGTFEPRLIVPTGARRSWTFPKAPRFTLDPVTQGAKRTLVEEGGEEITPSPSNCKVRLLENRDALFLPSQKRLATKKYQRKRTSISSPSRKSLEFVRLRRRDQFKRRLQRVDSGICMESDEDLDPNAMVDSMSPLESGEDIKLFDASAFTFTGLSVEMTEATETAETTETTETTAEDDMEIEDSSISTITTTAASSEGDADSDPTSTEQATSSSKDDVKELGVEGSMTVDEKEEKEGKEEEGDSGIDVEVEDAGKEMSEQKEVNNQLSAGDSIVKERVQKRLGTDGLVKLGSSSTKREVVKEEEEADDEEDEPPRRSTRRRSVKPLPTTVEEEEEEEEKGREGGNTVVVKRRSSRIKAKEEEQKGEKEEDESEKETEKEEKKEEKKEKKKLMRRKAKAEELESEASEDEREDEKKLKRRVKEETKAEVEEKEPEVDKMEEDTDESLNRIGEDTDMSTDEEITDFIPEAREKTQSEDPTIEEDVTMSEDDEMIEEVTGDTSEEQLQKEAKEEIDAGQASKNTEEAKDIETTDADDEKGSNNSLQVPTIEVKRAVRRLVLTPSKKDEFEISKMLSVPRTPRTPRSPNMSRFNITMSKAPRKLEPLLSPRRRKFNKPEDLSPHWTMKRLAAKKRQQPFNPANISRHAYRDPINDEDLLTTRKCFWDDDEVEEPYVDDQYLRVEWPLKSWGSSWMAENGGALIEFCVRKLEGFNMAW